VRRFDGFGASDKSQRPLAVRTACTGEGAASRRARRNIPQSGGAAADSGRLTGSRSLTREGVRLRQLFPGPHPCRLKFVATLEHLFAKPIDPAIKQQLMPELREF